MHFGVAVLTVWGLWFLWLASGGADTFGKPEFFIAAVGCICLGVVVGTIFGRVIDRDKERDSG